MVFENKKIVFYEKNSDIYIYTSNYFYTQIKNRNKTITHYCDKKITRYHDKHWLFMCMSLA